MGVFELLFWGAREFLGLVALVLVLAMVLFWAAWMSNSKPSSRLRSLGSPPRWSVSVRVNLREVK